MMAKRSYIVILQSILDRAREDSERLDWLTVPYDQRIIDDDTLEWLCGTSKLLEDVVPLAEEKENQDPAPEVKRAKLDVTPRSKKQSKRFENIAASPELASSSKGYIPPNTEANTQWAVRTFDAWRTWRSTAKPEDPVPEDILSCADAGVLNKWLSLFVLEAQKLEGSKYPSNTLNMLLSGLKRYMVRSNPDTPNFLDEKDPRFSGLRGTRDTVSRRLREEGVGASVKHTAVISYDEESALWESGVIGVHNPKALLNAVFFLNGKVLCLRGG